jgi:hypothetical protein
MGEKELVGKILPMGTKMERYLVGCKCNWWKCWFGALFVVQIECDMKQTSTTTLQKDKVKKFLGIPNARCWSNYRMHIRLGPHFTLHIDWIISNIWICKWCIELIITNIGLLIARPLEVLIVIYDKMDYVKITSPCFAHRIKA